MLNYKQIWHGIKPIRWLNKFNLTFLNMVMTFVLHPLSHYNSITEPRARFFLSLIEDLSIDFLSHFILSLIDVYKNTATRDKLIFPSAITRIIRHSSVSYPKSPHFTIMCAISAMTSKERGLALTEAPIDRDSDSSNPFHSIHLHSFFFFRGWCDAWGNHAAALAHGCSP